MHWVQLVTRCLRGICGVCPSPARSPPALLAEHGEYPAWTLRSPLLPPDLIAHVAWMADTETRQRMGFAPRRVRDVVPPATLAMLAEHVQYRQEAPHWNEWRDGTHDMYVVIPSPSGEAVYQLRYECQARRLHITARRLEPEMQLLNWPVAPNPTIWKKLDWPASLPCPGVSGALGEQVGHQRHGIMDTWFMLMTAVNAEHVLPRLRGHHITRLDR